jgi:hypothetical protein
MSFILLLMEHFVCKKAYSQVKPKYLDMVDMLSYDLLIVYFRGLVTIGCMWLYNFFLLYINALKPSKI